MRDDALEVVWNGAEGLTTVGPQRPGAVSWRRYRTSSRHAGVFYQTAEMTQDHAVVISRLLDVRWRRRVEHDRRVHNLTCDICRRTIDTRQRGGPGRIFSTVLHGTLCQRCYVCIRYERGHWASPKMRTRTSVDAPTVLRLRYAGRTVAEIAAHVGTSITAVWKELKRLEIEGFDGLTGCVWQKNYYNGRHPAAIEEPPHEETR